MANTFYYDACNVDAKMTPFPVELQQISLVDSSGNADESGLSFYKAANKADGELALPHSIMNDNVAINYRTIYNGYPGFTTEHNFTEYSDYLRCIQTDDFMNGYLRDKKNPTYKNIISYYNSNEFDKYGLAKYKMQDFIYLKYYNQIPNNYMVTLRRYTKPCRDHMFGLDMEPELINLMNNYPKEYMALATAVTYMGEKTGNKLSSILKFDYGAKWEEKEGKTEEIQHPDGGLAAQMKNKFGISEGIISGDGGFSGGRTAMMKQIFKFSALTQMAGKNVTDAMADQHQYDGVEFFKRYGEQFYGDINVVNQVKIRGRGLTFSNNFSLTFEYSLKSLKCVNPRIAMMDIICNFLILTGNYGTFWGGATIFYGRKNIAPQFGDPQKLREGKYGEYLSTLFGDIKSGFSKLAETSSMPNSFSDWVSAIGTGAGNILSGGIKALIGNLLGGNIGVAGQTQVPQALLSGEPSGFWHVTIGNPLDPIAMMGNMAVKQTTVEFNDILGYDDFPTEVKFTVSLEHCMPRDNANIESMFNAGKGRIYSFTDGELYNAYHNIDSLNNFKTEKQKQETTLTSDKEGNTITRDSKHSTVNLGIIKQIGSMLN